MASWNIGDQVFYFTILEKTNEKKRGYYLFRARCVCGKEELIHKGQIFPDRKTSCGCIRHNKLVARNKSHGLSKHPLYARWKQIRNRCHNPNSDKYIFYGARGIEMCEEWRSNPQAFFDWYLSKTDDLSLTVDRKDNNGNYEPDNCRLITIQEQQRNRRPRSCYRREKDAQ